MDKELNELNKRLEQKEVSFIDFVSIHTYKSVPANYRHESALGTLTKT